MEKDDPLQDGGTCAGNKRHKDMGHSNGRHTFAQVIEAAWDYLEASTTHAIRRSCRDGLALHDRVCTGMTVALGWIGTEEEVQGTLARAAARGFKPKSITVETIFSGKPGQDKNQSLRHLLAACRALPQPKAVTRLVIDAPPLDPDNADAIADIFRGLQELTLYAAYDCDAEDTVVAGAVRLLTRCGPRLANLKMDVCGWTPPCLVHLRACTALTSLELRLSPPSTAPPNEGGMCQRVESSVLDSVGCLVNLRRLCLRFEYDTTFQPDGATSARQHATALQQLSSLTALTSLDLALPHRARYDQHWSTAQQLMSHSRAAFDAWQDVWDTQEWALGQALRCMPHLTELHLKDGLHLRLMDLAALTALTHVRVSCISLPREDGLGGTASLPALPPNLCSLDTEASVETLAALRLRPGSKRLQVEDKNGDHIVWFGPSVLTEDGSRLLPAAVEAVRGAVQLLAGELAGTGDEVAMDAKAGAVSCGAEGADRSVWDEKPLELESRGTPKRLLPPAAGEGEVQQDHAAWIGELAPLDRRKVVFTGFTLEVTDLMCMASTFSRVKVLALYGCRFPVAGLPALAQLPLLETLVSDVSKAKYKTPDLVASMVLTAVAAPHLVRLRVSGCGHEQDVGHIRVEVQRGLALRGRSGVQLHVLGGALGDGADEEDDVFEDEGGGLDEGEGLG